MRDYPDLSTAKPKRKDGLVPDPQEFDFSDPDRSPQTAHTTHTAKARLDLFERMAGTAEND